MVLPKRVGDWQIDRALGRGGMGTVLRAHAPEDPDHPVAIKLLEVAWHPEALARFRREASLLQAVDHPGIVRIYDARLDAETPYLVMELVDGEDLGHLVERLGALPVKGALLVALAIADALAHLHARGVYHRDIKPANVIVMPDRSVKLVDFGIAREEGTKRLTEMGHRVGTPAYAPPEWSKGDGLPQQWDLYALGTLLDEMLTGRERFPIGDEKSPMVHAVKVMAAKAQLPCFDPGPEIPLPVREFVRELTAKDAKDRPQTAREVHHLLQELLRDPVVLASTGLSDRSHPGTFESEDDRWLASEESHPRALTTAEWLWQTVAFSAVVAFLSLLGVAFVTVVAVTVTLVSG